MTRRIHIWHCLYRMEFNQTKNLLKKILVSVFKKRNITPFGLSRCYCSSIYRRTVVWRNLRYSPDSNRNDEHSRESCKNTLKRNFWKTSLHSIIYSFYEKIYSRTDFLPDKKRENYSNFRLILSFNENHYLVNSHRDCRDFRFFRNISLAGFHRFFPIPRDWRFVYIYSWDDMGDNTSRYGFCRSTYI